MAFNHDRNNRSGGDRGGFRSRPSFGGRPNFQMHKAICDNCGKECEVPFRPTSGKPVYCSNCFGEKKGNGARGVEQPKYNEQFEALNSKLDKILEMLTPKVAVEEIVVKKKTSSKKK